MARKRSMGALALAVVSVCLAPSVAGASHGSPRIPGDAPVVAGPTASGARLVAFDYKRKLCVALLERREPRRFAYPDCARPVHDLRNVSLSTSSDPRRTRRWGIVEPEVASVDLVFPRGRVVHAATSAGSEYTGRYADRVRFLLVETRDRRVLAPEAYLRLYDAEGALLGLGNTLGFEGGRVGPARRLARGTSRGARWALTAERRRTLASLPGDEERFVTISCVAIRTLGRPAIRDPWYPRQGRATACVNPEARSTLPELAWDQECGPIGIAATGMVPAGVRRVVAVLGDGTTRRLPLRRLPASGGARRAFALVLGPRVAVRRVVAISRSGGRRVLHRGMAPGAVRCGTNSSVLIAFGLEPGVARGPLALTVYDDGVQLCATLARPSRHPYECRYPPIGASEAWVLTRTADGRKLVAGIVPSDVMRAVIRLRDGSRLDLETRANGVYDGRYAGHLRFFAADLDDDARIEGITLFDSHGRRTPVFYFSEEEPEPVGRERLVVGGPPGLRLRAGWHGDPREEPDSSFLCIALGGEECSYGLFGDALVRSSCTPRRLVFWGLLARGQRGVTVETSRGDFRARVRRLPPALRVPVPKTPRWLRRDHPVAAFVAAIPADARPSALVVSGRRDSRRALKLPPASKQCGYDDSLF